jgi:hypothetical protein
MNDEDLRRSMTQTIETVLDERWPDNDEMWRKEIRPIIRVEVNDEDFIKRIATPLTMKLLSIGIQAGIRGITDNAEVFEQEFEFMVAPSGAVGIRFKS